MDFDAREVQDGVRLSWNSLPKSKLQHHRNVIPFGSLYTPLNNKTLIPVLPNNELFMCRQCRAVLNPYVQVNNELWSCHFCGFSNRLGNRIDGNGQPILPASLGQDCSTVEYLSGRTSALPPIFFYVVDTCFDTEDIEDAYQALKESLVLSLSLLPDNALVGLISFGKHVQIFDLLSQDKTAYTFNGNKNYTLDELQKSLGFLGHGLKNVNNNDSPIDRILGSSGRRFLQPISIVEYQLTNILESLVTNTFPRNNFQERPDRSTGCALNVASLLLQSILGDNVTTTGGHIMCFIGGACTYGPGKIVHKPLKEPLRSHHDIEKSIHSTLPLAPNTSTKTKVDMTLFKEARKFYAQVTKNIVSMGLSCNYFIGSYDQIGLYEMDEVCYKSGGVIVMSDSFSTAIFKQSFVKFFNKQDDENSDYLDMGFNSTLECKTSSDLKIQGLIGNATALPVKKDNQYIEKCISNSIIGEGSTTSWKLCNVNPQSTYALYYEKMDSNNPYTFVQFLFHYQHPSGELRLRVTTIPIPIIADSDISNLELGFDQEAALVLVARAAIIKLQPNKSNNSNASTMTQGAVIKYLDKQLIDYCARFAVYRPGDLDSFRLSSTYAMFPQFLYHLRRSPFINVFNNSPDETSFVRHIFMHEDVTNSLIMVQPTLLSYDVDTFGAISDVTGEPNNEPEPVLLDSMSLGHTKVLLLDTFFHILIFHGSKVAEWRKAKYHEQEEYAHFKTFLEAPKKEAIEILMDRFPLPRFIDCDEGGSQARFLMAKLNPSTSYTTNPNQPFVGGLDILTDDTNLQLFMNHVQRIVIAKK
ncbi:vWA-like protein [Suhomyces tanzawaensis NRRL Y-17324]|uniref:Protein transport protein SEC23 n=1 Tax=Suhomyces tanzawaensis NRRL Y-17324 TaxID=984487 RepID=A0A1E4SHS1_9ASCO|nr:vWA-like protein [Suhomyces tanzawaensis NRRL Y-17324]ODV79064.1 vWA-like protein [Suhomyces tanzawaensis NRRL Y-17324]